MYDYADKKREIINETTGARMTVGQWLAIRKEAGRQIDPETAEVDWWYAQTLDPYGVDPDLPEECQQIGREYFACDPGSDVWVSFGDLPDATRSALWEKHKSKLAFPAGLLSHPQDAARQAETNYWNTRPMFERIRKR
jgi:hypothetical protein